MGGWAHRVKVMIKICYSHPLRLLHRRGPQLPLPHAAGPGPATVHVLWSGWKLDALLLQQ